MSKPARPVVKVPSNKTARPQPPRNTQLSAQTRKLLAKHYRAKHGVR